MGTAQAITEQFMFAMKGKHHCILLDSHEFANPTYSYAICWVGTFSMKKIWLTTSSTPAKNDWLGILPLLAHFGKDGKPEQVIAKISQETLAEMVDTTRSRVSFFMNRFRKLGFIDYNGGMGSPQFTLNVGHD